MLYSHHHDQLYKHICMRNHINDTIMTRSDTILLEKYATHFIWKGCVWEGVGDRTELQHIDPHSYGHQRFFPVLLGCSTGGPGPSSLLGAVLSTASFLHLSDLKTLIDREPEGSLCWVLAFSTASFHQLVWSPNCLTSCLHWVI